MFFSFGSLENRYHPLNCPLISRHRGKREQPKASSTRHLGKPFPKAFHFKNEPSIFGPTYFFDDLPPFFVPLFMLVFERPQGAESRLTVVFGWPVELVVGIPREYLARLDYILSSNVPLICSQPDVS